MLPNLSEEENLASKVTEEEKVLQLVGERDSKGQPHGEVKTTSTISDCNIVTSHLLHRWKSIMPTVITSGATVFMESRKAWLVLSWPMGITLWGGKFEK